nr:MAG TPA: hypothetical protein [Caudoviricetes sp.]
MNKCHFLNGEFFRGKYIKTHLLRERINSEFFNFSKNAKIHSLK